MPSIKAHFDGNAIVLDEPASLTVGQRVQVFVDSPLANETSPTRPSLGGIAKGTFESVFSPHAGPTTALMTGEALDERVALHVDPLDRVPPDFVRTPGSGAGQIKIGSDFDATPEDFKEIL